MDSQYILDETENYAVVFKQPKMHCTFANNINQGHEEKSENLYEWYAQKSPDCKIMHRLDYETHGLVLFAKNEKSYLFFKDLQDNGEFVKEYSAVCCQYDSAEVPGFPPYSVREKSENIIESYFRPFGPGRKLVRPVIDDTQNKHKDIAKDKGGFYRTEIININDNKFTVQIRRGFRHQIRCHLCWIGCPILNDPLYPQPADSASAGTLALRAHALFFKDPATGKQIEYRIDNIN